MKTWIAILTGLVLTLGVFACTPPTSTTEGRSNDGMFAIFADPDSAGVYVDGQYIGEADRFDGKPGYLQIASGTHRLAIKAEGYRTWQRDIYSSNALQEIRVTLSPLGGQPAGGNSDEDSGGFSQ